MSEASVYASLIGLPMMAVSASGDIYATGVVESIHVKPSGKPTFWAKLSESKAVPIKDLVHLRPMEAEQKPVGLSVSASDPDLLRKLKVWFAGEIEDGAPLESYEYPTARVFSCIGEPDTITEYSKFVRELSAFDGHVFEVRRLGEVKGNLFRIGFRKCNQTRRITFILVEPSGKEAA